MNMQHVRTWHLGQTDAQTDTQTFCRFGPHRAPLFFTPRASHHDFNNTKKAWERKISTKNNIIKLLVHSQIE
jgi:hypothetical protein